MKGRLIDKNPMMLKFLGKFLVVLKVTKIYKVFSISFYVEKGI